MLRRKGGSLWPEVKSAEWLQSYTRPNANCHSASYAHNAKAKFLPWLVSVDKRQRKRLKQGAKAFEPWPNGSARRRTPQTSFGRTWRLVLFTRTCTRKHACLCQKHTKSTEHMTGATAWALRYDAVHFSAHCIATVFRFQDRRG